jgi:hypothetical protein
MIQSQMKNEAERLPLTYIIISTSENRNNERKKPFSHDDKVKRNICRANKKMFLKQEE